MPLLEAVNELGHQLVGVLSRPDTAKGRSKKLRPSPVARRAEELGVPVYKPAALRGAEGEDLITSLHPDLVVVVAYGMIIPKNLLSIPRHGWVNVHYSLLPRWRGAAPVQRAIEAGDTASGVSIFQIEEGLDTGPVWDRQEIPIGMATDAPKLFEELNDAACRIVGRVVGAIEAGETEPVPQVGQPTYAHMYSKADQQIDWSKPAQQVSAQIRAFTPTAWTCFEGTRMKIALPTVTSKILPVGGIEATKKQLFVGTASTALELGQVSPAGKKWMGGAAWARGAHLDASSKMGEK